MAQETEIHRGLADIYFDKTQASFIDGQIGKLLYRGYNIHDLATHSTFEETAYLLMHGRLPKQAELAAFDAQLRESRDIPSEIYGIIETVKDSHPMVVLRTAVSALAAFDPDLGDNSEEAVLRKGIRLCAQFPTIVMAHHAIRNGKDPIAPNKKLNHAANFLYMLEGVEPTADAAHLMDTDFVLHAEHGSNASAFTARVVTGTKADIYGAITAAVAALAGPAHGGAAEAVMDMALQIGEPEHAGEYVKNVLANGGRVMGFGHRVYKVEDPRARHLREGVRKLGEERGEPKWYGILEAVMEAMKPYQRRGIYVNVDFFAGAIYHLLGIPEDLFVPIFAVGRTPGWVLQVLEQQRSNILLRPRLVYTGPQDLPYVPISER